ncbi:glycosyltransferase family 9 protein [Chryseobacterium sp. VAUSW3]|uniref:glycosyltransferase family 9 protein n=1 Tax=Chryseobacterium sp. VAUSW3 TaxID=2010998 RepID=UPI000B4C95AB|nr:glycosyltransferase family 9 protein [Chryseobacterium sp. VAUSW3]OWR15867.1 glycosyl transferase [Chryseobacterium sp. VAUSW3]
MTILAYRFSAFGDVAMTVPVVTEFLEQNPEMQIVFVTRKNFSDLFEGVPNLIFKGVNIDDYKGFLGLRKLAKELITEFNPHYIADLHDVIRTKILNRIFSRKNYRVAVISKGKDEKEHLTDIWNLEKKPLKKTTERYADVFRDLGFSVELSHQYRTVSLQKNGIGFAPFAQHEGKMLPLEKSFELAKHLSEKYRIYFFGGGKHEVETLDNWVSQIPNSENVAGKLSLKEELLKIAGLEIMISMDSANMHLASLVGTRCISVWGATHPYAGFLGYGQHEDDVIQVKDLTCRPCSVFGDKKCYRGDWACLHEINIQQIMDKIQ